MKGLYFGVLLCAGVFFSGCASIVSHSTFPVTVTSTPPGVHVKVKNENGIYVHEGDTPFTVTLKASDGYFDPMEYTVESEYGVTEFSGGINGWYFGNIIFGGAIGLFIVDPLTGAMFRLDDVVIINSPPAKTVSSVEEEVPLPDETQ